MTTTTEVNASRSSELEAMADHPVAPMDFPNRSYQEVSFNLRNFFRVESVSQSPPSRATRSQLPVLQRRAEVDGEETVSVTERATQQFNGFVQRYHWFILLCIVTVVWPLGFRSFVKFQSETDSTFRPIPNSLSERAQDAFRRVYADLDFMDPMHPPLFVVLEATSEGNCSETNSNNTLASNALIVEGTLPYEQGRLFSQSLLPYLEQQCWTWPHQKHACETDNDWLRVTSFYSLMDRNLSWIAHASATARDGSFALIQVEYMLPEIQSKYHKWRVLRLMEAIDEFQQAFWNNATDPPYFTVRYTGIKYFSSDLALSTRRDLKRMDVLVLPLALILLGIVLPSGNPLLIWIVPVVSMITTVSVWAMLMLYVVTPFWQISTFTPTIMMSLTLGMGVDYTLFLLSRYLEEMSKGGNVNRSRAILIMLTKSGHVLILSGLTLAAAFVGLAVLPLGILQSIGIGAATAILSAVVVNLATASTLLYTPLGMWIVVGNRQASTETVNESMQALLTQDDTDAALNLQNGTHQGPDIGERLHRRLETSSLRLPHISLWLRMSKHILHPYKSIIVLLIICQLLFPIAEQVGRLKSSMSFDLLLPARSPSLQSYDYLAEKMGMGSLTPFRILFDGRKVNLTMTSEVGFDTMHRMLDMLQSIDTLDEDSLKADLGSYNSSFSSFDNVMESTPSFDSQRRAPTMYSGISVLKNIKVPHQLFTAAIECARMQMPCRLQILRVLTALNEVCTSQSEYATYITASLGVSPFSEEGTKWLRQARAIAAEIEQDYPGLEIYIDGSAGIASDAVESVYAYFPCMIVVTTAVVFTLVGVFFQSCFQPIRSLVSICMTLLFSFGLSVFVFQGGIVRFPTPRSTPDEFCWLVPIMGFSIIVGLAMDYDVFLISRILEFRSEGYEHKSAVALGLDATGSIITAAGAIMALAFGSLMFSSNPVLYQWSFLVTSAVLFDTFVVRSIVVPILTGLAGRCCWWPRQLPAGARCFEELRFQQYDDVAGLLRSLESTSEYEPLDLF
jgi:uncharacterized membrane protein YdfJ with MMPL/SSD domain